MKKAFFIFSSTILIFINQNSLSAQVNNSAIIFLNSTKIGKQEWTSENLNVSNFRNGDPIPEAKSAEDWMKAGKSGKSAWCYYNYDSENGKKYGKLYNWFAVNDPRSLAPQGWHISTDQEWTEMLEYLGGETSAGKQLKMNKGWNENGNGNNKSGFAALPAGVCDIEGIFDGVGSYTYFWTATEGKTGNVWDRVIHESKNQVSYGYDNKRNGLSVRCVKD